MCPPYSIDKKPITRKSRKRFIKKIDIKASESNDYATQLRLSDLLREPVIRSVIRFLHLPTGSQGTDIG